MVAYQDRCFHDCHSAGHGHMDRKHEWLKYRLTIFWRYSCHCDWRSNDRLDFPHRHRQRRDGILHDRVWSQSDGAGHVVPAWIWRRCKTRCCLSLMINSCKSMTPQNQPLQKNEHHVKYRQFSPTCPPQAGENYLNHKFVIWVQSGDEK